jgi:hypothetical protein
MISYQVSKNEEHEQLMEICVRMPTRSFPEIQVDGIVTSQKCRPMMLSHSHTATHGLNSPRSIDLQDQQ